MENKMNKKNWIYDCKEKTSKKKKNEDKDNGGGISTTDNHIYFYDSVNTSSILDLRKEIAEISLEQKKMKLSFPTYEPIIHLHINTEGGYVTDGLNAMDFISNNDVPIETIVEGMCASAGTLLSVAGAYRKMQKNSVFLVHQIRGFMWGTQSEMEDEVHNIRLFDSKILEFYEKRSKLKLKDLKEMLKNEKMIDSNEALRYGFIDEII